jgi:predicted transposase YbfD/YdcC
MIGRIIVLSDKCTQKLCTQKLCFRRLPARGATVPLLNGNGSTFRVSHTSLTPDAVRLNGAIRQHWGIENKLHWVLDVGFGEDLDRKRAGDSAQNFSVLS